MITKNINLEFEVSTIRLEKDCDAGKLFYLIELNCNTLKNFIENDFIDNNIKFRFDFTKIIIRCDKSLLDSDSYSITWSPINISYLFGSKEKFFAEISIEILEYCNRNNIYLFKLNEEAISDKVEELRKFIHAKEFNINNNITGTIESNSYIIHYNIKNKYAMEIDVFYNEKMIYSKEFNFSNSPTNTNIENFEYNIIAAFIYLQDDIENIIKESFSNLYKSNVSLKI